MVGERTLEGWEARLRTRDPGRYVGAAFLTFWLCGWAVGEGLVLWLLIRGAIALLTGTPPGPGRAPLALGPALMVGVFLLVWLTLWTFGGIAAIGEWLRLLWGEDRLLVSSGRLTVTWTSGPLRRRRTFERDAIRRIALVPPRDHLELEYGRERVELTRLGTRAERAEVLAALRSELALADVAITGGLPDRWEAIVTSDGERVVVPMMSTRRSQARTAAVVALGAAAVTFVLARDAVIRDPAMWAPAIMALAVTLALAAGTTWLARAAGPSGASPPNG